MSTNVRFSNVYSECEIANHSRGKRVARCISTGGASTRHFVHKDIHAVCEMHHCLVLEDPTHEDIHNVLSCTGVVMRFDDERYFFNPLTPMGMNFSNMKDDVKSGAMFLDDTSLGYYFQSDVRTTFRDNILNVTCTDGLQTCVTLHNGTACFGNVDGTAIVDASTSLAAGALITLAFGLVRAAFLPRGIAVDMLYLVIPAVGAGMVFVGANLSIKFAYFLGTYMTISVMAVGKYWRDVSRPQTQRYDAIARAP